MPIYLYECESCGVRFERMQRMSEGPLTDCPECEGHVHRVIQPVGVIFKGSGFYITDNRQVSSPTLAPAKETKSEGKKVTESAEPAKEPAAPKETPKAKSE
jgi:putative FmdB family regulatory protein